MCQIHPCDTAPAIQSFVSSQSSSNTNELMPQILNSKNNHRTQQIPAGLVLPPADTDLAKEIEHFVDLSNTKEIPVLPNVDAFSNIGKIDVNKKEEESNSFPTLIPWNSFPETKITSKPTYSTTMHQINNRKNNGAVDGISSRNGKGAQISQSRRNKLSGILKPPTDSLASFSQSETSAQNEYDELNELHENEQTATETSTFENVPPLPAHPETTWMPLKFNIKPSLLNTSSASRTTQTDGSLQITTKSVLNNIDAIEEPQNILRKIEEELHENTENYTSEPITISTRSNRKEESVQISGPISFSSSFSRRGDLPIPHEEKPSSNFDENEKMWTKFAEITPANNNKTNNYEDNTGLFGGKINMIIDHLINQKTIDTITSITGRRLKTQKPTNHKSKNIISIETIITTPSTMGISLSTVGSKEIKQCGKAPDFLPCVEKSIANYRLLSCCRQKLMPQGCLDLCRYDVTQAEIKKAFDAAKCGIFNVAPFLECASQGEDNTECCRQKDIERKSGPQCEVFCNSKKGFGTLGLQHLSCQNVIGDLLKCHHSGLRPT